MEVLLGIEPRLIPVLQTGSLPFGYNTILVEVRSIVSDPQTHSHVQVETETPLLPPPSMGCGKWFSPRPVTGHGLAFSARLPTLRF